MTKVTTESRMMIASKQIAAHRDVISVAHRRGHGIA
jgi:hypothetical protein